MHDKSCILPDPDTFTIHTGSQYAKDLNFPHDVEKEELGGCMVMDEENVCVAEVIFFVIQDLCMPLVSS